MQLYASKYPQQVAGLVLVDSMHEDQLRYPELRFAAPPSICQALAPFGMLRLLGSLNGLVAEYPSTVQPAAKAQFYQTRYCQTASDEYAALEESLAQVHAARHPLGHLPLVVLTRGVDGGFFQGNAGKQVPESWRTLQKDLLSLSTNSSQMIATRSRALHPARPT
jgi:pimeloyl-ACP methyl ester carboxylesterase